VFSGCEFLNSTLALISYRGGGGAAAIFLELVAAAEWFELPETEDRTAEKAARTAVSARTVAL
jgi:hypothetical protein